MAELEKAARDLFLENCSKLADEKRDDLHLATHWRQMPNYEPENES